MVNGRRVRGRKRYQMIDDIKVYEYGSCEETKKKAENGKDWKTGGSWVCSYDGWINFENETQDRQEWRNAICEREGKGSGFSYDLLDGARTTFRGMVLHDQPGEYCRRNGRTYYEHGRGCKRRDGGLEGIKGMYHSEEASRHIHGQEGRARENENRDDVVNFRNQHVWADENSHAVEETRHQHRFSINVWAGVFGDRLRAIRATTEINRGSLSRLSS
ncbi:hypothetical protein ANN_19891 [Periplaneta americana]|uniref:Uncharacterized protein n=1 Tax=Periplaneta americana TaxID=6978 RepID=A0ABQ8SB39_PERAM|nr:hypothetical protein ANN_19891 [Periplaneta americana]